MAMEDMSERKEGEAPGGLEKEERQSVQGYIAIKGTRNGLLLTLEPETPFSDLLTALSERLAEAPGFFRGASLAVDTTRRDLQHSERTQLEALLAAASKPKALSMKVSEKGAISIYGLGRFPITLYRGQMERLISHAPTITAFIQANSALLSVKP